MKWSIFLIVMISFVLFVGSMSLLATTNKNSLNYNTRDINNIDDVVVFLEECKTKFAMNCEKLLLDKIGSANVREVKE